MISRVTILHIWAIYVLLLNETMRQKEYDCNCYIAELNW